MTNRWYRANRSKGIAAKAVPPPASRQLPRAQRPRHLVVRRHQRRELRRHRRTPHRLHVTARGVVAAGFLVLREPLVEAHLRLAHARPCIRRPAHLDAPRLGPEARAETLLAPAQRAVERI